MLFVLCCFVVLKFDSDVPRMEIDFDDSNKLLCISLETALLSLSFFERFESDDDALSCDRLRVSITLIYGKTTSFIYQTDKVSVVDIEN